MEDNSVVNAIEIKELTKYYGKVKAVDSLSLTIRDREIFGLLGPNGAGKTTTILTIATVLKPTSGTVFVYGYDVTKQPDKVRKIIGVSFQEPKALHVDKVIEILTWHGRACGLSGQELKGRVKEVMDRLGIWEHKDKLFMELSGGFKKRVEVAKLLIQKPKIAIFDEPTAQIDVIGRHEIWRAIRELREEGSTLMIATNNMNEAEVLCDRVAIIHKGKLVTVGSPNELKDKIPGGDVVEIIVDKPLVKDVVDELTLTVKASSARYVNNKLILYLDKGEAAIPRIIEKLGEHNYYTRQVRMKEPTLDDVFFYFTGVRLLEGGS